MIKPPLVPSPSRSPSRVRQAVLVDVVVVDDAHRVEIRSQGKVFAGEVRHTNGTLSIGDEVHLRVDVGDPSTALMLLGEVNGWTPRLHAHAAPLLRGLRFVMLLHRATVRGHDVAPSTFIDVAPGAQLGSPVPAEFGADEDDPDATEVMEHPLSSSLASHTSEPQAAAPVSRATESRKHEEDFDGQIGIESDDDDDTLVMPQLNGAPTSIAYRAEASDAWALSDDDDDDDVDSGDIDEAFRSTQDGLPWSRHPSLRAPRDAQATPLRGHCPSDESLLPQRTRPSSPPPEAFTGVAGRLERMGVIEVLQSLEVLKRTARVDFSSSTGVHGEVFVEEGQLLHASFHGLTGREAMVELLQVSSGHFRILFDRTSTLRSVDGPANFFLIDCIRIVDERRHAQQQAPVTAVGPAPLAVRDRQARERTRRRARDAEGFHLAPPR